MDAFSDGKFPFGTDCSFGSGEKAYCLNGKCVKFGDNDLPVDNGIKSCIYVSSTIANYCFVLNYFQIFLIDYKCDYYSVRNIFSIIVTEDQLLLRFVNPEFKSKQT